MVMKKIIGIALTALVLSSCSDAGDRTDKGPYNEDQKPPSSDPNQNPATAGPKDNSTTGVQDTSTVIDYDTAARKRQ
ncbi:MAG: hypothetical protein JWP27_1863 [Flaviaesturariibacter sp.]|nr:hypothetical protein [Flaviaesturariibacter sp.]